MLKKILMVVLIGICNILIITAVFAAEEDVYDAAGDEQATFISVAPDALMLLDLSGSMAWNPQGGDKIWGLNTSCAPDATSACSGDGCSGGYCSEAKTSCDVNCSRLAIAKRALYGILNDDNNSQIDSQDSNSLGVRLGYMRFKDGNDTSANYAKGNILLIRGIGSTYQQIYCSAGATGNCLSANYSCASGECIAGAIANGGTPLASALNEAKLYMDYHKSHDDAKDCRQKFIIFITDGADTYACGGDGGECGDASYKRRREAVAKAKAAADAGYKVFMVGFGGSMPVYLQNSLNWMAYYGGTDNPLVENTGSATAYDPTVVVSCQDETVFASGVCQGDTYADWFAATNDPGSASLTGYAFLATNAAELTAALKTAIATVKESTYSFTQSSVQAVRTLDENFLYEASFEPLVPPNNDSFWKGHLKRYSINSSGYVSATADWDAGEILKTTGGGDRSIYTLLGGVMTEFTGGATGNITKTHLDVLTDAKRDEIITFVRNGEQSGANINWKMGDSFHSSPITIGTPSVYYFDTVEKPVPSTAQTAFEIYRQNHLRPSDEGKRLLVLGANDGQFRAFKLGEASSGGGTELWSFIPPNLLKKLQAISHASHPTSLSHQYFVDGPTFVSDIWTGTGTGETKDPGHWKTYLVMAEGRGGNMTLWSSSGNCDTGLNNIYDSGAYPYYCGYYAFDVTETTAVPPTFKWRVGGASALTATQGNHLAQPWSKMVLGRVKISGNERWVGFFSAGYSGTDCKGGGSCDTRGKGFYVVDAKTGEILWTFTHSGPDGAVNGAMDYSLVATPAVIDWDNDGFVDTVYVGDLGTNMWRFKFCLNADGASCGTSNWSGRMFLDASSGQIRPIFNKASVVRDDKNNVWVYFGTGDVTDPTAPNAQEHFYGMKDNRTSTYTISDIDNITSDSQTYDPNSTTLVGWRIQLAGGGQKILAEPTVFQGIVYFTTYTPGSATNPCESGGDANLFAVDYITGAGKYDAGVRSSYIGQGIAGSPVVSFNPSEGGGVDIYVGTSEASGVHTQKQDTPDEGGLNRTNILYWRDLRLQN